MSSSISKATLKAFYHVTLFAHKAVLATEEVSALQEKLCLLSNSMYRKSKGFCFHFAGLFERRAR